MDRSRRLQLEALQLRSAEQLKEEVLLIDMMSEYLPKLPAMMSHRDMLISRLAPIENYLWIKAPAVVLPVLADESNMIKKGGVAPVKKKKVKSMGQEGDRLRPVEEAIRSVQTEPGASGSIRAALRSSLIKPVRQGLGKQVERLMLEHEIPLRPFYPCRETIEKYNHLRELMVQWIDLRRSRNLSFGTSLQVSANSSAADLHQLRTEVSSSAPPPAHSGSEIVRDCILFRLYLHPRMHHQSHQNAFARNKCPSLERKTCAKAPPGAEEAVLP